MPRKNLLRSDRFPYHITCRTNNREHFPLSLDTVWKIFEAEFQALWLLYGVEFQAAVLMPNHIHIILTVPNEDLGLIANLLFKNVAKEINSRTGRSGHVFGGPYFWSIIMSTRYYGHVLKYVYRNPVRAGLCSDVEDWPYSTVRGLIGLDHLAVPLYYTRVGMELNIPDPEMHVAWLDWLNIPFTKEAEELVRLCLRKKKISTLINRNTRKPEPLLEQLL